MNKKAEREKNHLVLNLGCDWWGNNYLFYHQRRHSVRSHVINVVVSIVQVCTGAMWWKRIQSIPKRKSMIYFVISKPSVIQNVVKTTYRPHTHQQKWTKWAGREKNHLVLDSASDWGVKKDLFYPQRRHSVALTWSTLQYQLYKLLLCALELDKRFLSFKTQLIAIRHIRLITKKRGASSILS